MADQEKNPTVRSVLNNIRRSAVSPVLFCIFLFNLIAAQGLKDKGEASERRYINYVWIFSSVLTVVWVFYSVIPKWHSSRKGLIFPLLGAIYGCGFALWGGFLLNGFDGRPDEFTVAILLDILLHGCLAAGLAIFWVLGMSGVPVIKMIEHKTTPDNIRQEVQDEDSILEVPSPSMDREQD